MKRKRFWNNAIRFSILSSLLVFYASCGRRVVINEKSVADSIKIYYCTGIWMTFSAVTAREFVDGWMEKSTVITDSAVCRDWTVRKDRLQYVEDSLRQLLEVRRLAIFYQQGRANDSLFMTDNPTYFMQLNQRVVKPDSILGMKIFNTLMERDSVFRDNFEDLIQYF